MAFPNQQFLLALFGTWTQGSCELFTGTGFLPPKNIDVKEQEFTTKVIAKLRFEILANDSVDSVFGYIMCVELIIV